MTTPIIGESILIRVSDVDLEHIQDAIDFLSTCKKVNYTSDDLDQVNQLEYTYANIIDIKYFNRLLNSDKLLLQSEQELSDAQDVFDDDDCTNCIFCTQIKDLDPEYPEISDVRYIICKEQLQNISKLYKILLECKLKHTYSNLYNKLRKDPEYFHKLKEYSLYTEQFIIGTNVYTELSATTDIIYKKGLYKIPDIINYNNIYIVNNFLDRKHQVLNTNSYKLFTRCVEQDSTFNTYFI